ncbi:hypothetical protein HRED_03142 [Candidatus Haloredivivus sp. G17]|nr:hypothetical protein HRED_03142 [Candidatus Haloredivivus sp. G17]
MELNGRTGLGQGALDVTTWDHGSILLPKVEEIKEETREKISEALNELGSRELKDTFTEIGIDRNLIRSLLFPHEFC